MTNNMKNDQQIVGVFNECFESMLIKNESIDACLARYPQHAAELKPLLETTNAARAASSISPDATFRARARYEFRSALYDKMSRKERPALAWRWRWATIASTTGVLLLTSAGGVVAASSGSMPGQTLYQVKRTIENVQLTMTPSQAAKARMYATLADRRVGEIVYAAQHGDVKTTEDLTQQFMSDLSMVSVIAAPTRAPTFVNGSKQAGAPSVDTTAAEQSNTTSTNSVGATNDATSSSFSAPPTALAPAVTPSIIASAPPQVSVTQAAPVLNPTIILPQPQLSLSGITDPTLLKLLQQSSAKNIAELMSILDNVSPSVKAALLTAIQAVTTGYGQILGE